MPHSKYHFFCWQKHGWTLSWSLAKNTHFFGSNNLPDFLLKTPGFDTNIEFSPGKCPAVFLETSSFTRLEIILTCPEKYLLFFRQQIVLMSRETQKLSHPQNMSRVDVSDENVLHPGTFRTVLQQEDSASLVNIAHTERFNALKTTFTINWLDKFPLILTLYLPPLSASSELIVSCCFCESASVITEP